MEIHRRFSIVNVQLHQRGLEVGQRALGLANLGLIAAEDLLVGRRLAEVLGGLEDLALGLDALVDLLNLLIQLARLR